MLITKKKHNEIVDKKDKEIEFLCEEKRRLELIINEVYRIHKSWKANKIGNLKAITQISKLFQEENHG
jgi:hypothetical protein